MIQPIITLQEARAFLHIAYDDQNPKISMLVGAGSKAVLDYIGSDGTEWKDTSGELIPGNVPDDIKTATLFYVGYFFDRPDLEPDQFAVGYLPPEVESLLQPYWKPLLV